MIYIDEQQIKNAATFTEWINAIEDAFLQDSAEDFIMPQRTHVDFDDNTLLLMPCINKEYMATKLVTLFPGNRKLGKAPLSGLVILNDSNTGEPLAVLDGGIITALRTAAVGSAAVRHLAPEQASNLGIIGLGNQGLHQALFACSERKFRKVYIFDSFKDSAEQFRKQFSSVYPDIEVTEVNNTSQLCEQSEVIITATNSAIPVLPDDKGLLANRTIIGIGSYKPDMQEFPETLFRITDRIFIDTVHGLKESGDLIYPVKEGIMTMESFVPLGEVIRGKVFSGSLNVFKSVGMALFDLFGAKLVYEAVVSQTGNKDN